MSNQSKPFQPIAIVGQGCVLPGALDATELWSFLSNGGHALRDVSPGYWGVSNDDVVTTPDAANGDKTWTTTGAYVDGFDERFDATRYPDDLSTLDPVFLWTLDAATQAYEQAGYSIGEQVRGGFILGNLSYPTRSMSDYAEHVWRGEDPGDPRNRFMSGLPSWTIRTLLGLTQNAYSLDAACASSLYAIKLACDALHDHHADFMLAGGVNHADDLFLHVGFCALNAMSRTGQSRPFHRDADGLVPAEGAAVVALKRLEDAEAAGDTILGVIRAIGVSNDGRGTGMLVPSHEGQVRAMRSAYAMSGIDPDEVSYVECHATGTPIGDGIELESMAEVFSTSLPVGSMKSNVGHLITASGAAGLMKVLGGFKNGQIPPTLHVETPLDLLADTPFEVATELRDWDVDRKIAAVNNFGFGGNNAHLIVESYSSAIANAPVARIENTTRVVATSISGFVGDSTLTDPSRGARSSFRFDLRDLKFPPNDLPFMLPQQLAVLETAFALKTQIEALPKDRTGVFIGMQTDTEIARYGARWRNRDGGDGVVATLNASGVLGTMPNIVTNRLNTQFDLRGPSFSISSDDASGIDACRVAKRALMNGEIDAAIVGAVEIGCDPVHQRANRDIDLPDSTSDACVLFILRRAEDADGVELTNPLIVANDPDLESKIGYAHAAQTAVGIAKRLIDAGLSETNNETADGPTIKTYPAHWPTVRFETKPERPTFSHVETMQPAPTLPPSHHDVSAFFSPIPVVGPRSSTAPIAVATNGTNGTMNVVSPTDDPIAHLFQEVSQMHTQFLAEQTAMHQKFMGIQNAMMAAIRGESIPALDSHSVVRRNVSSPYVAPVELTVEPKVEIETPVTVEQKKAPVVEVVADRITIGTHTIVSSHKKPNPSGPVFDYEQIRTHASGKISDVYGPLFAQQDDFAVQVRMPEPPLLLCHRVTGIDCEPGIVGTGTLWSESDIPEDAWYLHAGHMPVGIMIESGQADLMLCSWMGSDFENRGDRCYRLLGCELMFHGGLAKPGDVLKYDIHIDGHARQNDIRLFFFHYDLEIDNQVRLSVRSGQAGFFTYDELKESKGVIWDPLDEDLDALAATPFDDHPCVTTRRIFDRAELERFAAGETYDVFGDGFERAAAHSATPTIAPDSMLFMDEVLEFDPTGGPWKRGYLKAVQHIDPDDWFFPGHFKNDPCMPGTLMFEGAIQTMAFYMAACGWTIDRDGWIFEPVQELPYLLRCRGQVSTTSKELVYEVFVREVHDDGEPKLFADLMCTVDGLAAFHCARMGLQMTPAWPMDRLLDAPLEDDADKTKPAVVNGFEFGIDSLVACAWGTPSRAFGAMYEPFDSHRKVARLPGPPYHFISRVTEIDPTAQNAMRGDVDLTVEYDVPTDAWYFEENGAAVMPYAVILEAALQPCGWLASYVGCALTRDDIDLCFRNLDGTTTQFVEVTPETGTIETRAKLKNIARAAGNIIVSFDVEMVVAETSELVLTMDTVFGFFPPSALAEQVGLPIDDSEREKIDASANHAVDFADRPTRFFDAPRLAEPMLLMIDRVDFWDPTGGAHGIGRARARKTIDPREWFFKAHFFQDPVQPGSLGLEALLQLLQYTMIEKGLGDHGGRFEAIAIDQPMTWKYRGQVLTHNKEVSSTIDLVEIGEDERGLYALAEGSLWVDGMRIYTAKNIGMRIVKNDAQESVGGATEITVDPDRATWLFDHCPTYTRPALPAMSIVDYMAQEVTRRSGLPIVEVNDVTIEKWVIFNGAERLRIEATPRDETTFDVVMDMWWEAPRKEMSRFDRVASATFVVAPEYTSNYREPNTIDGETIDPYTSGELFHGPAFQSLVDVVRNARQATGVIDVSKNGVPRGAVQPGLLDAALQIIPHDTIEVWHDVDDVIAYPFGVSEMTFHKPAPTDGLCRSEVTFAGGDERFVHFDLVVFHDDAVWMTMRFTEVLVPKGPIGRLPGNERRAFILDKEYVPGARLSAADGTLDRETVKASNWFRGTVESIYGVGGLVDTVVQEIRVKDRAAEQFKIHPSKFDVTGHFARPKFAPIVAFDESGESHLDLHHIKQWWRNRLDVPVGWLGDDLYGAMIDRFVSGVRFENLGALESVYGRSVLFLANHEVQIESVIITMLASVLSDTTVVTMANAKHERGWVGGLIRDMFSYPGCTPPNNIVYFDQSDPGSMLTLIDGFKRDVAERGASVMVHAPGTRAIHAGEPVTRLSSALLDMALDLDLAIVPIYFDGGLPIEPLRAHKLEFPIGQTGQTYHFGTPILPEILGAFEYRDRRGFVLDAINRLAPEDAAPNPPVAKYIREVAKLRAEGWDEINATLYNLLMHVDAPDRDASRLIDLFTQERPPTDERDAWIHSFVTRRFRL